MHYAISTKILGQTHMWHTQRQAIKLFEDFSIFMGFWIFEHTQKQNKKRKSTKTRAKQKLVKETWTNKNTWDLCNRYATKSKKVHTRDRFQGMISTPMVLHKVSNFRPSRGLVNMFAFWLSVVMNSKYTVFSSTRSWMKWYRISICSISSVGQVFLTNLWHLYYHRTHT